MANMNINSTKTPTFKVIGTHNGCFHCDEVTACVMLKYLQSGVTIERTRDPEILSKCDIVVDVGGVYDPDTLRFDHHQRDFEHTFNTINPKKPWRIKLSSAGLVYCHFGHEVIARVLGLDLTENYKKIDLIYDKVYENFIIEIDAIDNGICVSYDVVNYHICTSISSRVGHLNPSWTVKNPDFESAFESALNLVREEFVEKILYYHNVWYPCRAVIEETYKERFTYHPSGNILVFDKVDKMVPWKDHLFFVENEALQKENPDIRELILYVCYKDDHNNIWRIQTVPPFMGSFDSRLRFPKVWAGLRDEELCEVTEIEGSIFVHAARFIAGHKTREGAILMAEKAMTFLEESDNGVENGNK